MIETETTTRAELPRKRYRPRRALELASEVGVLAGWLVGVALLVEGRGAAATLAGVVVLTVVAVQAILLFHDNMHQSAYGHRRLEGWIGRIVGAFYGCPFHFLRHEHLRHHRHAGLVEDDPEALHLHETDAARRPQGRLLARIASSAGDAWLYTWLLQLGQFLRWARRQLVRVEDRELVRATLLDVAFMLAFWIPFTCFLVSRGAYGRVLLFGFLVPALLGLALVYKVAKPLHTLMIPFRLEGLSYAERQFAVSRTFETHPVLALLVCNLSYHLEHHLYPHVSRWDLPRLSREIRPALVAFARRHDLPLAIHDGYTSWIRNYPRLPSAFNPIEEWSEWTRFNRAFDYVHLHTPERRS